jgi:hypothetical protein
VKKDLRRLKDSVSLAILIAAVGCDQATPTSQQEATPHTGSHQDRNAPQHRTMASPANRGDNPLELDSREAFLRYWATLKEFDLTVDVVDDRDAEKPIIETIRWILNPQLEAQSPIATGDPGRDLRRPIYTITAVHSHEAASRKAEPLGTSLGLTYSYEFTIEQGKNGRFYVCQDRAVRTSFESTPEKAMSMGLELVKMTVSAFLNQLVRDSKSLLNQGAERKNR